MNKINTLQLNVKLLKKLGLLVIFVLTVLFISYILNKNHTKIILPIFHFETLVKENDYYDYENNYKDESIIELKGKNKHSIFMFSTSVKNNISYNLPDNLNKSIESSYINYKTKIEFLKTDKIKKITKNEIFEYSNKNTEILISKSQNGFNFAINKSNKPIRFLIEIAGEEDIKIRNNGYLVFTDNKNNIISILQRPSVVKNLHLLNYNIKRISKSKFEITLENKNKITESINFSYDWYFEKNIIDCEINQNKSNYYLSNINEINNRLGLNSSLLIKINLKPMYIKSELNIKKAVLALKVLSKDKPNLVLKSCLEQWCSLTVDWYNMPKYDPNSITGIYKEEYIYFDITSEIEYCLNNKNSKKEEFGFIILNKKKESVFLATADNSTYPPFICIDYY